VTEPIKPYPRVFVVTLRSPEGLEAVHAFTASKEARAFADAFACDGCSWRIDMYRRDDHLPRIA
jgi:hypothetical protein